MFSHRRVPLLVMAAVALAGMRLPAATGQINLSAGDIAIIGWIDNGSPDTFAFVPFVNLTPGTTIYFTDNGWQTAGGFRGVSATDGDGNEQLCRLVVNALIDAGTIIQSGDTTNPAFSWTFSGSIPPGSIGSFQNLALATSGEQVYGVQSSDPNDNPLYTAGASPATLQHLFVLDDTNGFENATTSGTGDIPPGLMLGQTALTFNLSTALAIKFDTLTLANGTREQWLAAIANAANWQTGEPLPTGSLKVLGVTTLDASHVDCDSVNPVIDGALGADEYGPGNSYSYAGGGTGFGGVLNGSGRLYFNSSDTDLYVAFDPNAFLNDYVIVYLDTRAGGYTDATMDDTADPGRAAVTNLTAGEIDEFPFEADFALMMHQGGCTLFELTGGSLILRSIAQEWHCAAGSDPNNMRELRISLSEIDGAGGGKTINAFAAYCSGTNFNSNESIPPTPNLNSGGNLGFGPPGAYYNHYVQFVTLPAIVTHPQDVTACLGGDAEFAMSSSPPPLSYSWQEWDPNNPGWSYIVAFSPDPNVVVTAAAAKDGFRYRGIAEFPCGLQLPTNEAELRVFSAAGPTRAVQAICVGDRVSLSVAPSDPNLVTEYRWFESATSECSGGTQVGSNSPSLQFTAAAPGTLYYRCEVDAGGCLWNACPPAQVNMSAAPSVTAGANSPLCEGVTLLLSADPNNLPGATYSWSGPNGFTSSSPNPSITEVSKALHEGTYTVEVSVAGGCSTSSQVAVTIQDNEPVTASSNSPVCETELIQLSLTSADPNSLIGATFDWSGPNGFTSSVQNPALAAGAGSGGIYEVTVTRANGCVRTDQTEVLVSASPNCTISAPASVCANSQGHAASVPSGSAGATYAWTIAGGTIVSGQGTSSIIFDAGAGASVDLGCTVTEPRGCDCVDNLAVPIDPNVEVLATIVLSNVVAPGGGLSRCVHYVARDGNVCVAEGDETLLFTGSPATATLSFTVSCGMTLTSVCAKDEQHTLFGATAVTLAGSQYVGDEDVLLAGGDTNNNSAVDINDITLLIAQFGQLATAGGCPFSGMKDADFDNNGAVLSADYTFLVQNWLMATTCACTTDSERAGLAPPASAMDAGQALAPSAPTRARLSLNELPADVAAAVDFTGDGAFDHRDVEIFETINGLPHALSHAMRR